MIECIFMEKITIDSDLTESAIDDAILLMKKEYIAVPVVLVVNEEQAFIAGKICNKYGFGCIVLPDSIMKRNSWVLCSGYSGVWSEGA